MFEFLQGKFQKPFFFFSFFFFCLDIDLTFSSNNDDASFISEITGDHQNGFRYEMQCFLLCFVFVFFTI